MKRQPVTITQTPEGELLPSNGQIAKEARARILYGGSAGGKMAAMQAHMAAWINKNPEATVAYCSTNPDKSRIEKPAGSGKA